MQDKKQIEEKKRAILIKQEFSNSKFEQLTNATTSDRIRCIIEKPFKTDYIDSTELFIQDEDRRELMAYLSLPAGDVPDKTGESY